MELFAHCSAIIEFWVKASGPPYLWERFDANRTVTSVHVEVAVNDMPKSLPVITGCVN